ncbi:MAG: PLP-dependent aminotransferase family protein [Clostridiales bacterium]|nr:PLP-dependent aminotransferase family protein [Clostridiales bacterium]
MLTYSFENLGGDAMYTYLYKCMRADIMSGALSKGERLPSKRTFARHLGVSTITVENAYALLQTEGYIYSEPKRGYFVSDIQKPFGSAGSPQKRSSGMETGPDYTENKRPDDNVNGCVGQNDPAPEWYADFSSNQTRPENFPFSVWTKLNRQVMADQGAHLLQNPPGGGVYELRAAIAAHLRDFRDMHVSPEQIIVGAGTEYLYGMLIQLLGFDSIYAMEDPGYQKIGNIYEAHGVSCRYIELDRCGMRPELLEDSGANVIHISPSHHFPTGITMPISRRYELLGWAARAEGRYIIEDDYDSEFRMSGKPIPTLQSIDRNDQVIYINTFTKSLASTIRISYMVLPEPLLEKFRRRLGFYSCTVSNFEQYTLAAFIRDGYYEKHINRMRSSYRRKRNALLDAIAGSPLADMVTISEEDAGLHFLMHVDTGLEDEQIIERAAQRGIRITSLAHYYHCAGAVSEHTFVINYSNIEEDRIREAVQSLYGVF